MYGVIIFGFRIEFFFFVIVLLDIYFVAGEIKDEIRIFKYFAGYIDVNVEYLY